MRCRIHTSGVSRDTPPFFYPGCPVCEDKRARGLVRGDEGPLPSRWKATRIDRARWLREQQARARGVRA